jgi:hypothetical protein
MAEALKLLVLVKRAPVRFCKIEQIVRPCPVCIGHDPQQPQQP